MSNRIVPWKYSVFFRLLITFLLIMIPIYVLAVLIYNWGISSVRKDITSSMLAQVTAFNAQFEGDIRRVRSLMNDCMVSGNANMLSNASSIMDTYEKSRTINELQDRLLSIQKSCEFASDASLHISSLGKTISAVDGYREIQKERYGLLSAMTENPFEIVEWEGKLYLPSVNFSELFSPNREHSMLIDVELSKPKLKSMLQDLNIYKGSVSLMFFNHPGSMMFTPGDEDTIQAVVRATREKVQQADAGYFTINPGKGKLLVVYTFSDILHTTLIKFMPEDIVTQSAKKYNFWFWILTCSAMGVMGVYSVFTYRKINQPLYRLVRSFRKVEGGDLNVRINVKNKDEFGYLFHSFNSMVGKLDELVNQVYAAKILAQKAELKQLQAQINPHFLYNSFFILQRTIEGEDLENASLYARRLGSYFKFITRNRQEEIPLTREIEHARIYAEIQAMRFSRRIRIEFDETPASCSDIIVPRLILQPLLENAFEHGLRSVESNGLLRVSFRINENAQSTEGGIDIVVEDNGTCQDEDMIRNLQDRIRNPEDHEEVTALANIHKRLQLKFGKSSGLSISIGDLGGMKVVITINTNRV